jgi:hypothetical protein
MLEAHGEILPLETDDDVELWVFNAKVVDALDEAKSTIWRFPGSNRIGRIEKAVLRASAVRNLDIFRLPYRAAATYVSQRFVDGVQRAKLTGLKFEEVSVVDS